jgi:hypothetical protein
MMPRKKGVEPKSRTLIIRLSEQMDEDLRTTAAGLGIDVSNLVRMIFVEQLPTYIERGLDARRRAKSARAKVGEPEAATKPVPSESDAETRPRRSGEQMKRRLDM